MPSYLQRTADSPKKNLKISWNETVFLIDNAESPHVPLAAPAEEGEVINLFSSSLILSTYLFSFYRSLISLKMEQIQIEEELLLEVLKLQEQYD